MTAQTPACFAIEFDGNRREVIDMCSPHYEIDMEVLAAATDEVLIGAAKSGDRTAFVELWNRHSKIAFNMACRITGNREDAEDVVQDAWLRAYLHLNTFDGRSKFSTSSHGLPSIQPLGFYEGSVLVLRLLWRSWRVRPGSIGRVQTRRRTLKSST